MELVHICVSCSRTINKEYIYCPWCGEIQKDADFEQNLTDKSLELAFDKIQSIQSECRTKRVDKIRNALDKMLLELADLPGSNK